MNVATLGARGAFPAADYPGRALRPLARGVAFTTQGQTVVLPAHVCDRVRSDADAVLLSRRTTTWTGAVPVCAPWTTAEARGEYADPPASDGGIDSDVRDGQTDANNGDDDGGSIFQQINGTVNELPYAVAGIWMHGTDHAAVAVDVMDTGESFPTREIHNLVNGESSYTYRPLINGIDLDSFIVNESVEFYMRNQQTDEISHLRFDSATSREPIDTGTPGVTGATGVMFGFQNRGFVLSALVDRNVSLSKLETATKLQRLFTYDAIAPVTFHQRPAARAAAGGLMEVLAVGYDGTVHCIDDECRRGYLIDEGGTTLSLDSNLVAFGGEFFANDRRLIPDGQNWKAQPWLDPALDLQITSLATTEKLLCAVANQNVYCWTDPSSQTPHRLFNEDAMKLAIHGSGKRLRIAYSCSQPPNAVFYASIHEATIIANEEPFVNCTLPY